MKLRPYVYEKIKDIIDLNSETAEQNKVTISSVQITKELYLKINHFISQNNLVTHMRYGRGGARKGSFHTYTYKFHLASYTNREVPKYYISNFGASGWQSTNKDSVAEFERQKEETPTLRKLFYGILRKYPEHILNVSWHYSRCGKDRFVVKEH